MRRDDYGDYEDDVDDDPRRREQGMSGATIAALVAGGVAMLILTVGVAVALTRAERGAADVRLAQQQADIAERAQFVPAAAPVAPAAPLAAAQPPALEKRPALKMTLAAFRESVHGRTREQVEKKYGPPSSSMADPTGMWDGPISIYKGDFTGENGEKRAEVYLYYSNGVVTLAA